MLKVLQSNRLEILANRLSEALCAAGPLAAETIIVPNPGVARWLYLHLAKRYGISANLDCVLPGSFVWQVFHCLLPGVPGNSPFEPDVMTWRIHRLLLHARGDPAFSELQSWRDTDDDRRRFELARRLGRLFDQYIVYRPDWIDQWRRGKDTGWQPELWRRLAAETGQPDWMNLRRRLDELDSAQVTASMPQRINLFGIPLLSPGYLEVVTWLSRHIDVNLFLPNPCREHWAHIVPERELARVAGVADEKTLYIETGNALLASWGGQARDLLDHIQAIDSCVGAEEFAGPGNDTLLHSVQTQILELRDPGTVGQPAESFDSRDRSIQIHVCHSPTRELEVLHDRLLAMFDADRTLCAADVIVMTPDIDEYAPIIDAVFATPAKIPFYIADLSPRGGKSIIDTFLSLFELVQERFDANAVLAILESLPVRRRYGLAETDLQLIHDWVRDAGVRWGLDAAGRAEHGRADGGLHSWRRGLDRLLLGYALPGQQLGSFAGVLPYDDIEGSSALALGCLAEYLSRLQQLTDSLQQASSATDWTQWLHRQLDAFFDLHEDDENEAQLLRNAINSLGENAMLAGHSELIGIDVVLDWIQAQLDSNASVRGFLGHGVTFAGIVPMRNVPFRVVCLIGLNGDKFPRIDRPPGFDLIAGKPRRGDRSRRDDDRQAFLECLLNTRDTFYLGYVGRGNRDDNSLPPSVLVSEVIDYCNRSFIASDGRPVADALVTLHRVQPFSTRYFDGSDPALFTYTDVVAPPADSQAEPHNFFSSILQPAEEPVLLDLEDLIRFFSNPAKALLRNRLDVSYDGEKDPLETEDPVTLAPLAEWSLGNLVLELLLAGRAPDEVRTIVRNDRHAPTGRAGEIVLNDLVARGEKMCRELSRFLPGGKPRELNLEQNHAGIVFNARLTRLYQQGQYDWRYGKTRGRDRIALWLRHLVLNAGKPAGTALVTHWWTDDQTLSLGPVNEAGRQLAGLLDLYRRGMREPIPFFPESAWEYASVLETRDHDAALRQARKKYGEIGNFYQRHEKLNPYYQRVFANGVDWDDFSKLATAVCVPVMRHLNR